MIVENIMDAIKTQLTGLTTTGAYVQREQSYELNPAELPALIINEGEDRVEQEIAQSFIDWELMVDIDLFVRGTDTNVVTTLNTIRNEVHTALMVDYTLGITEVQFIRAQGTERPTIDVTGDMPLAKMRLSYLVKYRSNWANLD